MNTTSQYFVFKLHDDILRSLCPLILFFIFFLLTYSPIINANETALIIDLKGDVTLKNGTSLQPFIRLFPGDQVEMVGESRVKILYESSGYIETWQGQNKFKVGGLRSSVIEGEVLKRTKIAKEIIQYYARAPAAIKSIKHVKAVTTVRDIKKLNIDSATASKLRESINTYKYLRKQSPENDVSPEVYLLSVFKDLGLIKVYGESVFQEIKKRDPETYKLVIPPPP
ncbi:MAG: hypothetical protein ACKE9I_02345 [Methylophagaceae bacterium]